MLLVVCPRLMPNGVYYYIMYSYDKDEVLPVPSGIVRSRVQIAGWRLEKIGEKQTKVTNLAEVDFGGSIPSVIVSQGMKDSAYIISKLRPVVARAKAEYQTDEDKQ